MKRGNFGPAQHGGCTYLPLCTSCFKNRCKCPKSPLKRQKQEASMTNLPPTLSILKEYPSLQIPVQESTQNSDSNNLELLQQIQPIAETDLNRQMVSSQNYMDLDQLLFLQNHTDLDNMLQLNENTLELSMNTNTSPASSINNMSFSTDFGNSILEDDRGTFDTFDIEGQNNTILTQQQQSTFLQSTSQLQQSSSQLLQQLSSQSEQTSSIATKWVFHNYNPNNAYKVIVPSVYHSDNPFTYTPNNLSQYLQLPPLWNTKSIYQQVDEIQQQIGEQKIKEWLKGSYLAAAANKQLHVKQNVDSISHLANIEVNNESRKLAQQSFASIARVSNALNDGNISQQIAIISTSSKSSWFYPAIDELESKSQKTDDDLKHSYKHIINREFRCWISIII